MSLVMEIDEFGKEFPIKPFNLVVPLRTRLNFLNKPNTIQEANIQADCEHKNFERGICDECGIRCEHSECEESYCLECGEFQEPRFDDDYYFDQWRESRLEA